LDERPDELDVELADLMAEPPAQDEGALLDMGLVSLGAGELPPDGLLPDEAVPGDADEAPEQEPPEAVANAVEAAGSMVAEALAQEGLLQEGDAPSEPLEGSEPLPPLPDLDPAAVSVEGAPAGWTKTPLGYVFDASHRHVGRITSWGRTNKGVNCSFHIQCSLAKSRHVATDGQLMTWLAIGQTMKAPAAKSNATEAQLNQLLVAEHRRLWNQV